MAVELPNESNKRIRSLGLLLCKIRLSSHKGAEVSVALSKAKLTRELEKRVVK